MTLYIYWQRRFSFSCHRLIFSVATPLDSFHSLFSLRRGKDTDDNGPTELTKVSLFVLIFCCVAFLFTRFPQNKHLLPPKSSTQALRVALLIKILICFCLRTLFVFRRVFNLPSAWESQMTTEEWESVSLPSSFILSIFDVKMHGGHLALFSPSSVRLLFILFLSLRWKTAAAGIRKKMK